MKSENMYKLSVKQWSPFVGCEFDCSYCKSSFKAQAKRQRPNCSKCYDYTPHTHTKRLDGHLPRTGYMQFVFVCASGDIAFCPTDYLEDICSRMKADPGRTFLLQSKDPSTFRRVKFSKNVILGTTVETTDDTLYEGISKAPSPSQRYRELLAIDHPSKMVTIEPVIEFDLDTMVKWMTALNPCMVWLGYDSKRNNLPEPSLEKVKDLHWQLGCKGITVVLKTIREGRSVIK